MSLEVFLKATSVPVQINLEPPVLKLTSKVLRLNRFGIFTESEQPNVSVTNKLTDLKPGVVNRKVSFGSVLNARR